MSERDLKYRRFTVPKVSEADSVYSGMPEKHESVDEFRALFEPNELAELPVSDDVQWGVERKVSPHAHYYDVMVLQFGKEEKPTVGDISEKEGQALFGLVHDIAEDIHERSDVGFTMVDWNVTPEEYDRKAPQNIKRMHVHVTGMTRGEMDEHMSDIEFDVEAKKQMHDPFNALMGDIVWENVFPELQYRDEIFRAGTERTEGELFPAGLSVQLKDGIDTLANPKFFDTMQAFHEQYAKEYTAFADLFLSEGEDERGRPLLLDREVILENVEQYIDTQDFDDVHARLLRSFAKNVKDAGDVEPDKWAIKGVGYSVALFSKGKEWFFAMAPRIFNGLGGLEVLGIQLKRPEDGAPLAPADLAKREAFHHALVEKLMMKYPERMKIGKALTTNEERRFSNFSE